MTLLDVFPTPEIDGIFFLIKDRFSSIFSSIGITTDDEYHSIDMEYIYNKSGDKYISSLLEKIFSKDNFKDVIENILYIRFNNKWSKLIETLNYEYDPLSPYQMKISESGSDVTTNTKDSSGSYKTDVKSNDSSNTKRLEENSNYGFNSTNPVPTNDGNSTSDYNANGNTNQVGENQSTESTENSSATSRDISRTGNIGNHTIPELIADQRELLKYQILDIIYSDLDSLLVRSRYLIGG